MWYARPSEYVWHDDSGQPHAVTQAEGGEQGDPLMPALFSLGQHPALEAVAAQLQPGEALYAFLDDVYAVVEPNRVRPVYDLLAHHLHETARIRLNGGKTRIWNKTGHQPPNTEDLGAATWVGDQSLPPEQQGITVLGAPIGSAEHIQSHLQQTSAQHTPPLQHLPYLDDLQASWLLLLYTASTHSNYLLRMVPPHLDAIPVLQQQAPEAFAQILQQLQADHTRSHALEAAQRAATPIQNYGWQPPDWQHIADGVAPPRFHHNFEDGVALGRGWQHKAATATHTAFRAEVRDRLDPGSQALLESQTGPHASRAFTTIPYHNDNNYPSHLFRLLLLRRLRLPLPLSARFCRCRRTLDPLGDHRAACAQSGLLRARGGGHGTGSSPHMQGSGGTGNNKHPPGRSQPRTPRPPR